MGRRAKNPLTDGAAACTCVAEMNRLLVERNTKLVTTLFTGKVALMVEKRDHDKRGRPTNVLANYCPFCGVVYPAAPSESREP